MRDSKFPKKVEIVAYNKIKKPLRDALSSPDFEADYLAHLRNTMDTTARQETGYKKDEALRCSRAIKAFQDTFTPKTLQRYTISAAPKMLSMQIEGVKINVSLDASVSENKDGVTYAGGITLLYAFSADRGSVKDRLSNSAGLILWALDGGANGATTEALHVGRPC